MRRALAALLAASVSIASLPAAEAAPIAAGDLRLQAPSEIQPVRYRRVKRHHRRHGRGNAAAAALFGAVIGGILSNRCMYGGCRRFNDDDYAGYNEGGYYYGDYYNSYNNGYGGGYYGGGDVQPSYRTQPPPRVWSQPAPVRMAPPQPQWGGARPQGVFGARPQVIAPAPAPPRAAGGAPNHRPDGGGHPHGRPAFHN